MVHAVNKLHALHVTHCNLSLQHFVFFGRELKLISFRLAQFDDNALSMNPSLREEDRKELEICSQKDISRFIRQDLSEMACMIAAILYGKLPFKKIVHTL